MAGKTNGIGWMNIRSLWDFYDWHDNILIPAAFNDDIYVIHPLRNSQANA